MSTDVETGTYKDAVQQIKAMATDAFKDHVLTEEGDGRWLCKRLIGGSYWFRLITAPGSIIILGDVGECILRPHTKHDETVSWLRGAVDSPSYFVEKVQASKKPPFAFYPEECVKWLRDYATEMEGDESAYADLTAAADEAMAMNATGDLSYQEYVRIASEAGIDDAYDVGRYLSSNMLWMIELCRCFVRLHGEEQTRKEAAA